MEGGEGRGTPRQRPPPHVATMRGRFLCCCSSSAAASSCCCPGSTCAAAAAAAGGASHACPAPAPAAPASWSSWLAASAMSPAGVSVGGGGLLTSASSAPSACSRGRAAAQVARCEKAARWEGATTAHSSTAPQTASTARRRTHRCQGVHHQRCLVEAIPELVDVAQLVGAVGARAQQRLKLLCSRGRRQGGQEGRGRTGGSG